MTGEMIVVLVILGGAIVLFASDRVRLDVVAIMVLLALVLSGVLTVEESLAGFSDSVVIMIAGLFVVGEALAMTGIAFTIGKWLLRVGGTSEKRLIPLIMVVVAAVGAFMSSTGVVAIFIPIVIAIADGTGLSRGWLMMPLAFAALISGMMTLIATPPNLIVNGELRTAGLEPFGFFAFTPFGVVILVAAIVYMLIAGRYLLKVPAATAATARGGRTLSDLVQSYALGDRFRRLRVRSGSPLIGRTIGQLKLRTLFGVVAVGLERPVRGGVSIRPALINTEFRPGDILDAVGDDEQIAHFVQLQRLERLPIDTSTRENLAQELGLAEVMLAPDSQLIGQSLVDAAFRSRHRVSVLGIRRRNEPLQGALADVRLAFGDTLLVSGRWRDINLLQTDKKDFLVLHLPVEIKDVAPARSRAPYALAILLGMIVLMTFGLVPNAAAVLLAALGVVLTRCVSMEAAYNAINWPSVVLIAGMLPLATALQKTGGTGLIVDTLVASVGDAGPRAMMAALFVLTALIGLFVSNAATAVLVAPIAILTANSLGVSPYPFAMTVALAASAAFMTPISSPVNTLVLAPGNYRFIDFVKVGVPMTIIAGVISLVLVPLIFPL
jgi:di/tricarboxylate transporter